MRLFSQAYKVTIESVVARLRRLSVFPLATSELLAAGASRLQKGGVPAAPSGTATLLRLRPNRRSHLRQLPNKFRPLASGVTNFHDVTGGVYKARERIHRSVADLRLLATPTSWGRVADPNPN